MVNNNGEMVFLQNMVYDKISVFRIPLHNFSIIFQMFLKGGGDGGRGGGGGERKSRLPRHIIRKHETKAAITDSERNVRHCHLSTTHRDKKVTTNKQRNRKVPRVSVSVQLEVNATNYYTQPNRKRTKTGGSFN